MKPLSQKNAAKWLQKLQSTNNQSFHELIRVLKGFKQNSDKYDLFVRFNAALAGHQSLIVDINQYLDQGTHLFVQVDQNSRISQFLTKVKKFRPESYTDLLQIIKNWEKERKSRQLSQIDINIRDNEELEFKKKISYYLRNQKELLAEVQYAFASPKEVIIKELQLPHLKKGAQKEENQDYSHSMPTKKVKKDQVYQRKQYRQSLPQKKQGTAKAKKTVALETVAQQIAFFYDLETAWGNEFNIFAKFLFLYQKAIINAPELFQYTAAFFKSSSQLDIFKKIIASRSYSRKFLSHFKPLSDSNFQCQQRITPSYIPMPNTYPNICQTKNQQLNKILNDKYVSVPRGSQEQFSLRPKSLPDNFLFRAQDERYEYDIKKRHISETLKAISKLKNILLQNIEYDILNSKEFKLIMCLKIIQEVYKQGSKEQHLEIQHNLKNHPIETLQIIQNRISQKYDAYIAVKNSTIKAWNEVALKNFYKSLDFCLHEFKRIEKFLKQPEIVNQLKQHSRSLINRKRDIIYNPFQQSDLLFPVYSSFQGVLKQQQCKNRNLQTPIQYDLAKVHNPSLLPVYIFAFEDKQALSLTYSMIMFYIDNGSNLNEHQKTKVRNFLQKILSSIFDFHQFRRRGPNSNFNQEQFHHYLMSLNGTMQCQLDFNQWIFNKNEANSVHSHKKKTQNHCHFDGHTHFSYLPPQDQGFTLFLGSEIFYVVIKLMYVFYERIIKMRQIAGNQQNILIFELLFYHHIRTKEQKKYEDNLKILFGHPSYIFTTMGKVAQVLLKHLSTAANCSITNRSFQYCGVQKQEFYFLLMDEYICSLSSTNPRIVRFNFEKATGLLYIHYISVPSLVTIQHSQKQNPIKEPSIKSNLRQKKKIALDIEIYTVQPPELYDQEEMQNENKEISQKQQAQMKEKYQKQIEQEVLSVNNLEYCFVHNNYKLINLPINQDILVRKKRPSDSLQSLNKEAIKNANLSRMYLGI